MKFKLRISTIVLSVIFLIRSLPIGYGYKILYIAPRFARSHVTYIGSIADLLVEAGHDVTVFLPEMSPFVNTNGTKLAKTVTIPPHPEVARYFATEEAEFTNTGWSTHNQRIIPALKHFLDLTNAFITGCEHTLTFEATMEQLREEKFDLAIAETFDFCAFGLIEALAIPAHVVSCPSHLLESVASIIGVPFFSSYVPCTGSACSNRMTYMERAKNLLCTFLAKDLVDFFISREEGVFRRKYGSNFKSIKEKVAESSFIFINIEELIYFPRPTVPKVITVCGVSVSEPKPLSQYWLNVLERRPSAVLVSFGTMAESYRMPAEMKQAFLKTFDQFPNVTFIWKYEKEEDNIGAGHSNVVLCKWLPQNDLLHHPKVIAFVMHGGMNSVNEAARSGKPAIVVPQFGDQPPNAKMMEYGGSAIILNPTEIRKDGALNHAFWTIIYDAKYAENARKLARMIARKPYQPKERFIKHIEFAAEFGRLPHLDQYGRKMPFYAYYNLDIICPVLLIIKLVFCSTIYAIYRLCVKFRTKVQKSKQQ